MIFLVLQKLLNNRFWRKCCFQIEKRPTLNNFRRFKKCITNLWQNKPGNGSLKISALSKTKCFLKKCCSVYLFPEFEVPLHINSSHCTDQDCRHLCSILPFYNSLIFVNVVWYPLKYDTMVQFSSRLFLMRLHYMMWNACFPIAFVQFSVSSGAQRGDIYVLVLNWDVMRSFRAVVLSNDGY